MSQLYDLEFNKDDVVLRNILIGILATLNNRLYWYNKISQTEKKKVSVPFYFSTTGDERFLMDAFMNDVSTEGDEPSGKAETFYNKIPRGILQLDGINIDAGSMTNKFVRAFYQRVQEDGTLKTWNAEVFMVPLKLPFTCDIYVDSNLDIFKAIQRVIEVFYKHQVFQVDIDGTRIPAAAHLPEDYQKERPIEYSFTDRKVWKVTFSIEVDTFMPVFKPETEMFAGNIMQQFNMGTYVTTNKSGITTNTDDANADYSVDPYTTGNSKYSPTDAWPINPSGYSNPLPPDGGATQS